MLGLKLIHVSKNGVPGVSLSNQMIKIVDIRVSGRSSKFPSISFFMRVLMSGYIFVKQSYVSECMHNTTSSIMGEN